MMKESLEVLDSRWEDIDIYLESIPDEEIRSALLFLVWDGIGDLVDDNQRLKDKLFFYEESYTKDKVIELEREIEKLESEIDDLEDDIEELEEDKEELEAKVEELEYDLENSNQEETLDWEMVMDTFWKLRDKMEPWEFEKLIKEKYD